MTIRDLIKKTRTIRRFKQDLIDSRALRELVDLARIGGSARNSQPLRYMIVTEPGVCRRVFPLLGWAGYLQDWPGPAEGERPTAYIICLLDQTRSTGVDNEAHVDLGIATQNFLLGAARREIYGCRIGSFAPAITEVLHIPEKYRVLLVLALGRAAERVVLEEAGPDGDIRYWRDDDQIHHVPKRALDDIIVSFGDGPDG